MSLWLPHLTLALLEKHCFVHTIQGYFGLYGRSSNENKNMFWIWTRGENDSIIQGEVLLKNVLRLSKILFRVRLRVYVLCNTYCTTHLLDFLMVSAYNGSGIVGLDCSLKANYLKHQILRSSSQRLYSGHVGRVFPWPPWVWA